MQKDDTVGYLSVHDRVVNVLVVWACLELSWLLESAHMSAALGPSWLVRIVL